MEIIKNNPAGCLIKPGDPELQIVFPDNGETFDLDELQQYVGGLIDVINCPNDIILVVNDEYLFNNSEINIAASILANRVVCGAVVCCHTSLVP